MVSTENLYMRIDRSVDEDRYKFEEDQRLITSWCVESRYTDLQAHRLCQFLDIEFLLAQPLRLGLSKQRTTAGYPQRPHELVPSLQFNSQGLMPPLQTTPLHLLPQLWYRQTLCRKYHRLI